MSKSRRQEMGLTRREDVRRRLEGTSGRGRKLRGLTSLMRPYRGRVILMSIALVIGVAASLAPAPLAAKAIDGGIIPGNLTVLNLVVAAYIVSVLLVWVCSYAQTFLVGWVGQRALADLRRRIFEHLQQMPVGFYERRSAGVLISRMTNDVDALNSLVTDTIVTLFQATLTLLGSIAHHAAVAVEQGRAVMRGVLAQEIHHRVKNNLQTVASLLRIQARATDVDPRRALNDSVNRILAIAAVHEVLTERRDDDVDLAELLERLRATIVQGVGAGKTVTTQLQQVSLAGHTATALALVFSELLQNALEHGGTTVHVELDQVGSHLVLAVIDDGPGMPAGGKPGTGLSIVQALVRDELRGDIDFISEGGLRAVVTFPASATAGGAAASSAA